MKTKQNRNEIKTKYIQRKILSDQARTGQDPSGYLAAGWPVR